MVESVDVCWLQVMTANGDHNCGPLKPVVLITPSIDRRGDQFVGGEKRSTKDAK